MPKILTSRAHVMSIHGPATIVGSANSTNRKKVSRLNQADCQLHGAENFELLVARDGQLSLCRTIVFAFLTLFMSPPVTEQATSAPSQKAKAGMSTLCLVAKRRVGVSPKCQNNETKKQRVLCVQLRFDILGATSLDPRWNLPSSTHLCPCQIWGHLPVHFSRNPNPYSAFSVPERLAMPSK